MNTETYKEIEAEVERVETRSKMTKHKLMQTTINGQVTHVQKRRWNSTINVPTELGWRLGHTMVMATTKLTGQAKKDVLESIKKVNAKVKMNLMKYGTTTAPKKEEEKTDDN